MIKFIFKMFIFTLLFLLLVSPIDIQAEEKRKVLILYDLEDDEEKDQIYIADLLVGHFTDDIETLDVKEIDKVELDEFTHLIYLHMNNHEPADKIISAINEYKKKTLYIGPYSEMFNFSSFLNFQGNETISHIIDNAEEIKLNPKQMALKYKVSHNVEVLYEGKDKNYQFPLIFQHEGDMVVALKSVGGAPSDFIGEAMFDFFEEERGEPQRYIRLEDVNPLSDQKKLKEIGEYLYNKNIPYMIALIPVYTNPKTNEEIHLKDQPKLVNTLKYMQDHGASMIVHGYKHQYRETETDEGLEYWDVENDRPIYQEKGEKALLRSDFASEKEFDDFIKEGKKFEENYISETLDNAIKEMNEERLVPLAFEPPHYSMSLDGYKTVANYFSTLVGAVQISNESYMNTYNPVYTSRPSFLYGMELLPETLGYVDPQNDESIEQILANELYYSRFSNSQLGLFYHPYLGLDDLKFIVEEIEKRESYPWLDLKKRDNKVNTNTVEKNISIKEKAKSIFKKVWWIIIPFIVFLIIILSIQERVKKNKT